MLHTYHVDETGNNQPTAYDKFNRQLWVRRQQNDARRKERQKSRRSEISSLERRLFGEASPLYCPAQAVAQRMRLGRPQYGRHPTCEVSRPEISRRRFFQNCQLVAVKLKIFMLLEF